MDSSHLALPAVGSATSGQVSAERDSPGAVGQLELLRPEDAVPGICHHHMLLLKVILQHSQQPCSASMVMLALHTLAPAAAWLSCR